MELNNLGQWENQEQEDTDGNTHVLLKLRELTEGPSPIPTLINVKIAQLLKDNNSVNGDAYVVSP